MFHLIAQQGQKEIVRKEIDGYLISNDSIEFGRAASGLMADAELRRCMGLAAVEDAQHRFSPAFVLPKWRELIEFFAQAGPLTLGMSPLRSTQRVLPPASYIMPRTDRAIDCYRMRYSRRWRSRVCNIEVR